jgi:hypothetical protein
MYAENNDFPDRPDALPLNPIWNFETTSRKKPYGLSTQTYSYEDHEEHGE